MFGKIFSINQGLQQSNREVKHYFHGFSFSAKITRLYSFS